MVSGFVRLSGRGQSRFLTACARAGAKGNHHSVAPLINPFAREMVSGNGGSLSENQTGESSDTITGRNNFHDPKKSVSLRQHTLDDQPS